MGGKMNKKTIITAAVIVVLVAALGVGAAILIPRLGSDDSTGAFWPTKGWRTSTPEQQGFDSVKLAEGLQNLKKNKALIDSLLIIRNGRVLLDAYFYPYDPSIPHDLASVTKSFTTTLIGLAIGQGKIQLDQPMLSFFPNRTIANLDDWKESMTIRDLVSNTNGYESGCLTRDEPTLDAMRATPDWVQQALDRKMVREPGTSFCYDSPGMHLLSAIIQQASGMTEQEYAQKNLFTPLGIQDVYWQADPQGYTHGWGDLFLKPLDAAKLGYLWLNQGFWDGKQIIPPTWVTDSVKPYNSITPSDDYGYGWWVSEDSYFAFGRGGQTIKVYPQFNAIVVVTGNGFEYDQAGKILEAAFIDPENSLPPNPSGVAKLESVVAALGQAAQPWPSSSMPDTARTISGKTYNLKPNPLGISYIRLEFNGNKEAKLFMNDDGQEVVWTVGLDGKYRMGDDGKAVRGYWSDPQTFVFEVFYDGLNIYKLRYADSKMTLETSVMKIEGVQQNP
ncbi:MAG: 6-aminohexanoate hydrolase [Anaerolineales bacterium]|nr:MAG: 6-aminohexanoate hydrolase [Anaerolineales bacterium]